MWAPCTVLTYIHLNDSILTPVVMALIGFPCYCPPIGHNIMTGEVNNMHYLITMAPRNEWGILGSE